MEILLQLAPWIVAAGGVVAIIGAFLSQRAADIQIANLQNELQTETQKVATMHKESAAYLRGDDSIAIMRYRHLNKAGQHLEVVHKGPNPVWDLRIQFDRSKDAEDADIQTFAEHIAGIKKADIPLLTPGTRRGLIRWPTPEPNDADTWNAAIQFFTRSGTYQQLLLLHYQSGEWSQGWVVYEIKSDRTFNMLDVYFDDTFPAHRRKRAESLQKYDGVNLDDPANPESTNGK